MRNLGLAKFTEMDGEGWRRGENWIDLYWVRNQFLGVLGIENQCSCRSFNCVTVRCYWVHYYFHLCVNCMFLAFTYFSVG